MNCPINYSELSPRNLGPAGPSSAGFEGAQPLVGRIGGAKPRQINSTKMNGCSCTSHCQNLTQKNFNLTQKNIFLSQREGGERSAGHHRKPRGNFSRGRGKQRGGRAALPFVSYNVSWSGVHANTGAFVSYWSNAPSA